MFYSILWMGMVISSSLLATHKIEVLSFLYALLGVSLIFFYFYFFKKKEPTESFRYKNMLQLALYLFALTTGFLFSLTAGTIFLIIAIYLWYLNKNFFIENWLKKKPFFHVFLQNLIFIPLATFPYSLIIDDIQSLSLMSYVLLVFLTFLFYDFCHQLNPFKHPKEPTLIHYYGYRRIFYVCTGILFLSSMCAANLNYKFLLWPFQIALFIALCILFLNSKKYKFVESCAEIYAFISIFSVLIMEGIHFFK